MILDKLLEVTLIICWLIVAIWIGFLCHFGMDITDEGNYLVSIANPLSYSATVSQYGLLYSPIYTLLKGDLVLFRLLNLFTIVGLSYALFYRCFSSVYQQYSSIGVISISLGLSASALLYLGMWIPTPSYNSLNLIFLLFLAHLLLSFDNSSGKNVFLWLSLGLVGALLFIVKGTTALVAGLILFFYLSVSRKLYWRGFLSAVASALIVIFAVAIVMDGSIYGYAERIQTGIENGRIMLGDNWASPSMIWRGKLQIGGQLLDSILTFAFFILIAALLYSSVSTKARWLGGLLLLALVTYGFGVVGDVFINPVDKVPATSRIFLVLSIPLAAAALACINLFRSRQPIGEGASIWLIICMCLLPYAFALGTTNNYFYVAMKVGVFLLVAMILLICKQGFSTPHYRQVLVLSLSMLLAVVLIIDRDIDTPYRQPQGRLGFDSSLSEFGIHGGRLRLPNQTIDYLSSLSHLAQGNGFKEGDDMLDLTGASPGTLMAIGAANLASPWLLGGYVGSEPRAITALLSTSRQAIELAWVLVEPDGHRSISAGVLGSVGLDLTKDYVLVGEVAIPKGLGGRPEAVEQLLYRPK